MSRRSAKARKRERRRGPGKAAAGDPRARRRKAYERLFRRVGLESTWQRLPKRCREALYSPYRPVHWRVQPTARARHHERAAVVAALVEEVLDDARFGYALGDDRVTIRETMDLLGPLAEQIEADRRAWSGEPWTELAEALDGELSTVLWADEGGTAVLLDQVDRTVFMACAATNSFDRPYATVHFTSGLTPAGLVFRFTVDLEPDHERRFTIEGKPRKAYRVGSVEGADGLRWVDVPGAMFGLGSQPVPAFIQRHALRRLWQRMELDEQRFLANLMIIRACRQTHVVQREGYACWLAVSDPAGRRLGYLIAEPHDGVVLIRTFTFLTDSNAPEARKLRKLLREAGYDYHRLRLGELSTYLLGEVPDDAKLRAIFAEAGCAHLLELTEDDAAGEPLPER